MPKHEREALARCRETIAWALDPREIEQALRRLVKDIKEQTHGH